MSPPRRWLVVLLVAASCAGGASGAANAPEPDEPTPTGSPRPPDAGKGPGIGSEPRDGADALPLQADGATPQARTDAAPADTGRDATGADLPPPSDVGSGLQTSVPVMLLDVGKPIDAKTRQKGRVRIVVDGDAGLPFAELAKHQPVLDSPMGIRVRGNSSAYFFPKKSYSLELWDGTGASAAASVLGMPKESDWVLYACYADKTCLRNALIYTLAQETGRYAPRVRFVELFLDGQYIGLYNVVEKIKRDKNRVPIPEVAADAASGDLTGGYIIKRDGPGDGAGSTFTSKEGNLYTYHYPKETVISAAQKSYIQDYVNRFEAMMKGVDFADVQKGYRTWIDAGSFVDYLLWSELSLNLDGYRRSAYMWKQPDAQGGRLSMGPIWDYDLAFGNAYNSMQTGMTPSDWTQPQGFVHERMKSSKPPENVCFWWYRLLSDPAFANDVKCRWQKWRAEGPLTATNIGAKLDGWVKLLDKATARNQAKWHTIGQWVWPNFFVGKTYDEEIGHLRSFIDARMAWLDANLPGTCVGSGR